MEKNCLTDANFNILNCDDLNLNTIFMKINKDLIIEDTNSTLEQVETNKVTNEVLKGKTLYYNPAGATSDINLYDDSSKYNYLVIYYSDSWTGQQHANIVPVTSYFTLDTNVTNSGLNGFMSMSCGYLLSNNNISIQAYRSWVGIYFNYYADKHEWHNGYQFNIWKIIGYYY